LVVDTPATGMTTYINLSNHLHHCSVHYFSLELYGIARCTPTWWRSGGLARYRKLKNPQDLSCEITIFPSTEPSENPLFEMLLSVDND